MSPKTPGPSAPSRPDTSALAQWLRTWVQPGGAIHGFANHSVWGGYPALYGDDWAGHSTFASPLLMAWAELCVRFPEPAETERLETMLRFQCGSRQEDGQFDHVGFQIGERSKVGLIHNVLPAAALCETVRIAGDRISAETRNQIETTVREVLDALDRKHGPGYGKGTCANQEYARAWARLAHMEAFGHAEWDARVRHDLDELRANLHVPGVPDAGSEGCLRSAGNPDFLEPAEYYGLMIAPLHLAYHRYGEARDREAALALGRHVIRSAWRDEAGRLRAHRTWARIGGAWECIREPMLIGGFGLTLETIRAWADAEQDPTFLDFLDAMDATLAAAQAPGGPFLAATGWHREQDIIPASAWQSHDLLYLLRRHPSETDPWPAIRSEPEGTLVILGRHCAWLENGPHWKIHSYHSLNTALLHGRKDQSHHHHSHSGWMNPEPPPSGTWFPEPPALLRTETALHHRGGRDDLRILNASGLPYQGPGTVRDFDVPG